jgi:hypothetical protein
MLPNKFRFICPSGEDFQKLTKQKQELPEVAMFVYRSGPQELSLWRTFQRCFLPSSGSLAKQFQMRSFIEIYQPETRIAYGGHDAICFNLTLPLH